MEIPPINKTEKPKILQNQGKQDVTKKIVENMGYVGSDSYEYSSTEETIYVNMIGDVVSEFNKACDENSITDELLDRLKEKLEEIDKLEEEEEEEKEIQDSLSSNGTPEIEEPIERVQSIKKKRKQHLINHLQSLLSFLEKYYKQCVNTGNCPEAFKDKLRKTIDYLKGYMDNSI